MALGTGCDASRWKGRLLIGATVAIGIGAALQISTALQIAAVVPLDVASVIQQISNVHANPNPRSEQRPTSAYPSDPNVPTFAFQRFSKKGQGFYNQQMALSGAMMILAEHMAARNETYYQILLPSLVFLDYLGSEKLVEFDQVFDVQHWNSYVPRLPRIVSYNHTQHYQYNIMQRAMSAERTTANDSGTTTSPPPSHPFLVETTNHAFQFYNKGYMKLLSDGRRTQLDPTDRIILQDALRPIPAVQTVIDNVVGRDSFAAIHLRFEQDYLCHPWPVKDRNLSAVLERIELFFGPAPPFQRIFFAVNRPLLESPHQMPPQPRPSWEACQAERQENLATLNRVVRDGMWGGSVQVFERPPLPPTFRERPVLFGSLIDSEICVQASVFLGRFTSTFTKNIMRRRLIQRRKANYNYELNVQPMQGQTWPTPVDNEAAHGHSATSDTKAVEQFQNPLVSFVIPSTLGRQTLNRTMESLRQQTNPRWEAIVGVDTRTSQLSSLDDVIAATNRYYNDSRIRVVPITTESADRGTSSARNGAGGVRNIIMQQYARGDWVAFCDDDDTLTPHYIDYLEQGLHQLSSPDILIFRMHDHKLEKEWYGGNLPPLAHGPVSSLLTVGISFAVRRSVVSYPVPLSPYQTSGNSSILQFEPGKAEDFDLLYRVYTEGYRIGQTCCVGYYVRSAPPADERPKSLCIWEKGYVVMSGFRRVQELGPPRFNQTKVVPCPASQE